MFGALRLALAATVALFHTGAYTGDIWFGVSAVVIFYMLSGYAMTGLIETHFREPHSIPNFFLERIIRLAPQYYFWVSIYIVIFFYLRWFEINTQEFLPFGALAYAAVVPLGFQGILGPVKTLLMPQAVTLGIEMTFYLVSPWMLRKGSLCWLACGLSLAIFCASHAGTLPANMFTYYTSPGPLIFYILGSFIYKKDWLSVSISAALVLAITAAGLPDHLNKEICVGVVIGLPALIALSRRPANRLDAELGNASYGCFLAHGAIIVTFAHFSIFANRQLPYAVSIVVLSCVVGYLSYWLIERPTVPFRRRLRDVSRLVTQKRA